MNNAWNHFSNVARERGAEDLRSLVPVLGTGFRRWLVHGVPHAEALVDGVALVRGMAHQLGLPTPTAVRGRHASMSAGYEQLLHSVLSRSPALAAGPARINEQTVLKHTRSWLETHGSALARHTTVKARVDGFLAERWGQIVDLSLDPLLLSGGTSPAAWQGTRIGREVATIGATRVWHPHGTAVRAKSRLVLGQQRYGASIAAMVSAVGEYHKRDVRVPSHWIHACLDAPLLLLGVGLGEDEWDLWWFLQIRARHHARKAESDRPPVFRLTCAEDRDRDRRRFEDLAPSSNFMSLDGGSTWEDSWAKLFEMVNAC